MAGHDLISDGQTRRPMPPKNLSSFSCFAGLVHDLPEWPALDLTACSACALVHWPVPGRRAATHPALLALLHANFCAMLANMPVHTMVT